MTDLQSAPSLRESASQFADAAAATSEWSNQLDGSIHVDLRDRDSMRVEFVLATLAFLRGVRVAEFGLTLHLPESREQRDILRDWDFQGACEGVTSVPFNSLVSSQGHPFFGEPRIERSTVGVQKAGVESFAARLADRGFFQIARYELDGEPALGRMIEAEWRRWRDPLILQLLSGYARGPAEDVARVILQELLANAIQHPSAVLAVLATAIERNSMGSFDLVIAVWDDGESIARTLSDVAAKGIRAETPDVQDTFDVRGRAWIHGAPVDATWAPGPDASPAEYLAASILPGISRKPHAAVRPVPRPEPVEWEGRVGFGLHALYRTVVDAYGGSLSIRTDNLLLGLSRFPGTEQYDMEVDEVEGAPALIGNLVSVRLPLSI